MRVTKIEIRKPRNKVGGIFSLFLFFTGAEEYSGRIRFYTSFCGRLSAPNSAFFFAKNA